MQDIHANGRPRIAAAACLLLVALAAWHLEFDRYLPDRLVPWRDRPQSRAVAFVEMPDARIALELSDRSENWSWDWTDPNCLEALAAWARTHSIKRLELTLADPDQHATGLPVRSVFPEQHPESAGGGAWCEEAGTAAVVCTIGVLAGRHPLHVTMAVVGALYQGLALVRDPGAFTRPAMQSWSWTRLDPVVIPAIGSMGWSTACPHLTPDQGVAS